MNTKIDLNLVLLVTFALIFVSFVVVATISQPDYTALALEHCTGGTKWVKVEGILNAIKCN